MISLMRLRKLWRSCEIWPFARGIAENKIWESCDNNWVWNSIDKSFLQFCALFLSIRTAVLPDQCPLSAAQLMLEKLENCIPFFGVFSMQFRQFSPGTFDEICYKMSFFPPYLQPDTCFTGTRASLCALPALMWAHSSLLWLSVEDQRILEEVKLESG